MTVPGDTVSIHKPNLNTVFLILTLWLSFLEDIELFVCLLSQMFLRRPHCNRSLGY